MNRILFHTTGEDKYFVDFIKGIHLLGMSFDDPKIFVLTDQKSGQFLKFSPFIEEIIEYDSELLSSPFKIHKFIYNCHELFNIDTYIDFSKKSNSSIIGKTLKSQKRIGPKGGLASKLYNQILTDEEAYLAQLKKHLDVDLNTELLRLDPVSEEHFQNKRVLLFNKKNDVTDELNEYGFQVTLWPDNPEQAVAEIESIPFILFDSLKDTEILHYLNRELINLGSEDSIYQKYDSWIRSFQRED